MVPLESAPDAPSAPQCTFWELLEFIAIIGPWEETSET